MIEAFSKIKKQNKGSKFLEEHRFIANCLQLGLSIDDLKQMDYKDVVKILLSSLLEENENSATQSDIDKFLG